jgi:hypothetical protein
LRREEKRRTLSHAPHPKNDPQECGALRQGNIALIHSAPTGESVPDGEKAQLRRLESCDFSSFETRAKYALLG